MIYAHYSPDTGEIISRHDADIQSLETIPEPRLVMPADVFKAYQASKVVSVDVENKVFLVTDRPGPTLDQLKANALAIARQSAVDYHRKIAQATTERAIAWVMKALFAIVAKQAVGSTDPVLQAVTDATTDAFTIEAGVGGEDAADLQARAIQKAAAFLQATALVEGMERFAEHHLTAATTQAELDGAVAQLRAREADAADQLTQLLEGETDA